MLVVDPAEDVRHPGQAVFSRRGLDVLEGHEDDRVPLEVNGAGGRGMARGSAAQRAVIPLPHPGLDQGKQEARGRVAGTPAELDVYLAPGGVEGLDREPDSAVRGEPGFVDAATSRPGR